MLSVEPEQDLVSFEPHKLKVEDKQVFKENQDAVTKGEWLRDRKEHLVATLRVLWEGSGTENNEQETVCAFLKLTVSWTLIQ